MSRSVLYQWTQSRDGGKRLNYDGGTGFCTTMGCAGASGDSVTARPWAPDWSVPSNSQDLWIGVSRDLLITC